jgi:hypothetical protein
MYQVPRIQKARGERCAAQAGRFRPAGRGQVRPPGRRQQGRFPALLDPFLFIRFMDMNMIRSRVLLPPLRTGFESQPRHVGTSNLV